MAPAVTVTLAVEGVFAQTDAGAVRVAAGCGLAATVVAADVALQPLALVTVTLYEPLLFTTMVWVVAPFDQLYETKPGPPSSVTLPPVQKVVGPLAVSTGVAGGLLTVTVVAAEVPEHPPAFDTVTV